MITRERFADYLLLKKLNEDPLGEVFRAGKVGGEGVEHVVLLRVFNGSVVSDLDLGPTIAERKPLQALLRSPNLAQGVDAGVFQGVPYVAYEYISGKNLATLMEQAARKSSPVPTEHGLLVTERIALGLTVAYGARIGSQRATHGFLVPELVMLSNEGENRLLGYEVSEGLRRAAAKSGRLTESFGRYLSPEVLAGAPASSADDVYSLAVILLELFVGRPLPHPSPDRHRAAVERVSSLGFPKVAALIERSLLPAGSRIGDIVSWHKTLNQLILESDTGSTPFHLAFYMHNLFREDIERESAEIATEKTMDFSKEDLQKLLRPSPTPPPSEQKTIPPPRSAAPVAVAAAVAAEPATSEPPALSPAPPPKVAATAQERRSRIPALIGAFVVLALLGGGGFYAWWSAQQRTQAAKAERQARAVTVVNERSAALRPGEAAAPEPEPTPPTDTVPVPAPNRGPSPEDLMREIDQAINERTAAVEENLRSEYDQEIQALRDQLAATEAAREQERQAALEAQKKAEEAERLAATTTAEEEPATPDDSGDAATETQQASLGTSSRSPVVPASNAGGATLAASTADTTEAVEEPVRLGQLVTPGRGVVAPRVKSRPQPVFPMVAKRLRREADLNIEVLVDENGEVIDTRIQSKAGYGFDEAADRAAQRTIFFPATKNGVRVKMWTSLRISFKGTS
ncbi:MAG TPA: TonB family protein [Thermoanaerobaculia bacterium]|nr:TonB family protein [Thermoanaerobaculia bacterium]